jgi:hypothetical protein
LTGLSPRLIWSAEKDVKNVSILPECGIGRRPTATMAELLRIHAEAAGSRKEKNSERGWPHDRI